jgi:hypothetical protein
MSGVLGIERVFDDGSELLEIPTVYVFSLDTQSAVIGQRNYWGVSTAPANTQAFIKSLAGSAVNANNNTDFTVFAAFPNKIYFATPARYAVASFISGGLVGGFIVRASNIALTNDQGFTEDYRLYESVSAGLGVTVLGVY